MPDLDLFTYEALTRDQSSVVNFTDDGITARAYPASMRSIDPWIRIETEKRSPAEKVQPNPAWKIHLSVDVKAAARAWNAILPVLSDHFVHAKVMSPSLAKVLGDPLHKQAGKVITIKEMTASSPEIWAGMIERLEHALHEANIPPGWVVRGDRPIAGANYTSCRNDLDPSGHYSSAIDGFNPFSAASPFDNIMLPQARTPRSSIDPVVEGIRLLNMIEGGWTETNGVAVHALRSEAEAADLYRSMRAYGLPVKQNEAMLVVSHLADPAIKAGWHDAMEIRRAVSVGRTLVGSFPEGAAQLTMRRRSRGDAPPEIQIDFDEPEVASRLVEILAPLPPLRATPPRNDGGRFILPYGSRFHTVHGIDAHWLHTLTHAAIAAFDHSPVLSP